MDETSDIEATRARLLALAAAHNKAVLAGVAIALLAGFALLGAAVALATHARPLAAVAAALGGLVAWRGVRLHGRRIVRDLGAGRHAGAMVARAIYARGCVMRLADLEGIFPREDLLRALDFLGRLGLAWAEPREEGDVVLLDPGRARSLLA